MRESFSKSSTTHFPPVLRSSFSPNACNAARSSASSRERAVRKSFVLMCLNSNPDQAYWRVLSYLCRSDLKVLRFGSFQMHLSILSKVLVALSPLWHQGDHKLSQGHSVSAKTFVNDLLN